MVLTTKGKCVNTPESYVCECDEGYRNVGGKCVGINNRITMSSLKLSTKKWNMF